jgi:hypothetical protein
MLLSAECSNLTTAGAVVEGIADCIGRLHEALLHVAGQHPVLADVHYHFLGRHIRASTRMSVFGVRNRHRAFNFRLKIFLGGDVENDRSVPTTG